MRKRGVINVSVGTMIRWEELIQRTVNSSVLGQLIGGDQPIVGIVDNRSSGNAVSTLVGASLLARWVDRNPQRLVVLVDLGWIGQGRLDNSVGDEPLLGDVRFRRGRFAVQSGFG